jgi:hypothetical protein
MTAMTHDRQGWTLWTEEPPPRGVKIELRRGVTPIGTTWRDDLSQSFNIHGVWWRPVASWLPKPKVIQIALTSGDSLYVLRDDGTIWQSLTPGNNWSQIRLPEESERGE